uniref:Ubiquitin-like protease family profile domain-containing protein n=1 Tax=Panagrolaimus superbus TaxID=310955 RepID=A0A914YT65_9BILA
MIQGGTPQNNGIITIDNDGKKTTVSDETILNHVIVIDDDDENIDGPRLDEVVNNTLQIPLTLYNLNKVKNKEYIDDVTIDSVINKDVIQGNPDLLLVSATVWEQRIIENWGNERRLPNRLPTVPRYSMTFKKAIIPIHMPGHWNLAILDKDTKICTFYCTLRWPLREPFYSKLKLICSLLCDGQECEINFK